eukprot:COSAG05_NODE_1395_length_4993_cov_6.265836_10_plen_36_part_00
MKNTPSEFTIMIEGMEFAIDSRIIRRPGQRFTAYL